MTDLHDKATAAGRNWYYEGAHRAEEAEDVADRLALVAQRDALLAENERLAARVQHTQQWYAERWQWMQHWFRTTGKDLPIADQFWSVLANGTPDVNTPPTYQQQLNTALHRAEAAEAELKAQVQCTLQALNRRQEVEAEYRALCEAEPVAWCPVAEADLHGESWLALADGSVLVGTYEWRQGRHPDGWNTATVGRIYLHEVTHCAPYKPPAHPLIPLPSMEGKS